MKASLPYRRRMASSSTGLASLEPEAKSRWIDSLPSLIASFLGASLASILTLWITLSTLESFKAEENLRELALNELYRPALKANSACSATRIKLMNSLAKYEGNLKLASGYLNEFVNNKRSSDLDEELKPTPDAIGKFIETVGKTIEEVGENTFAFGACEREVMDGWMTLSIVLGIDKEFADLATARISLMNGLSGPIRDDDLFIQIITNPKTGMSMLLAASDGLNGNPSRSAAVMERVVSELKKSSDFASEVYKKHEAAHHAISKMDNEINRLFLKNLRNRFRITPTSLMD